MATTVVPATNIGIYIHIRVATDCSQSTNLSFKSLCTGEEGGAGITNTFGGQGGPAKGFDNGLLEYEDNLTNAPFEMSDTIGGGYS